MAALRWILGSCAALALLAVMSKLLGRAVDPWQLSLVRSAVGLAVLAPVLLRPGTFLAAIATRHLGMHAHRAVFLCCAMYCGFYGFTRLPLADATGLYFARPLFIVALAALWLGERVTAARWVAVGVGFAGMLVVIRPGEGALRLEALVSALGALLVAVAIIQVKRMQKTESNLAILFYSNAFGVLVALLPAVLLWKPLVGWQWVWLVGAGVFGMISQICMVRAYALAEPSALAPAEYLQIPFTVLLAFGIFGEVPTVLAGIGVLLIALAGLYASRQQSG